MSILSVSVSTSGMITLMRFMSLRFLFRKTECLDLNFPVVPGSTGDNGKNACISNCMLKSCNSLFFKEICST